jgi:hypothetical protein
MILLIKKFAVSPVPNLYSKNFNLDYIFGPQSLPANENI